MQVKYFIFINCMDHSTGKKMKNPVKFGNVILQIIKCQS